MLTGCIIPRQPDRGEVAPAQLAHNSVFSIIKLFTDGDGMVATLAVVFGIFLVGGVLGGVLEGGGGGGRALHRG